MVIAKLEHLLSQYKQQLECDFSLYDSSFQCLVNTDKNQETQYKLQKATASIEIGQEVFHLATKDKKNKDFLLLVAIACKNILENERKEITDTKRLEMAFEGMLTATELQALDQKFVSGNKRLFLLEFDKSSMLECKELIENIIEGSVYIVQEDFLIVRDSNENEVEFAHTLIDAVNTELMLKAVCCISDSFESMREIYEVRKSLHQLLRLRNLFYPAKVVMKTQMLGLAKLISSIPEKNIEKIQLEMTDFDFSILDTEEDLQTIYAFFDNNMNISQTAQSLFIHRNTLIYRLDRYQKLSGLDIRNFEDAIKLKIVMMMYQYLKK